MDVRPPATVPAITDASSHVPISTAAFTASAARETSRLPAGIMAKRALLTSPQRHARQLTPVLAAGLKFPSWKKGSRTDLSDQILTMINDCFTHFVLSEARTTLENANSLLAKMPDASDAAVDARQTAIITAAVEKRLKELQELIFKVESAEKCLLLLTACLSDFKLDEAKATLAKVREQFPVPTHEALSTLPVPERAMIAKIDEKAIALERVIATAELG